MYVTGRKIVAVLVVLAGLFAASVLDHSSQPTAGASTILNGLDVSSYQGTIDWTAVKNSGRVFAFIKATEGRNYTDPNFTTNWHGARVAGFNRGAYHYAHPNHPAVDQANFFYNTVHPHTNDLQMTLDIEESDGRTSTETWHWIKAFINQINTLTGRPGIIYTYYYFWVDNVGDPANNLNCPLWIAAYGTSQPMVPRAWSTWTFWQYTDTGRVPGISGNVDLDYFNGGFNQLHALRLP